MDGTYELFRHFFGQPPRAADDGSEIGAARGCRPHRRRNAAAKVRPISVWPPTTSSSRSATTSGPATRPVRASPPSFGRQFELLETALGALGVALWPMVELEADDALASAASVAADDPAVDRVIICTPDKDLAQCVVGERVVQLDRRKRNGERRGRRVGQVRCGSLARSPTGSRWSATRPTDFPGLAGWGQRSASTVLAHYGTFDAIPDDSATGIRTSGERSRCGQAGRHVWRSERERGRAVQGARHPSDRSRVAGRCGLARLARSDDGVRGGLPALQGPGTRRAGGTDLGRLNRQPGRPPGERSTLGREDLVELGRDRSVELRVGARRGLAVRSPPDERRGVAEPVALQMVVGDLGDQFGTERLPTQVLAPAPPALASGDPSGRRLLGQPGMCPRRILPVRLERPRRTPSGGRR